LNQEKFYEFNGRDKSFYRFSSSLFSLDANKASIVYIRFKDINFQTYDYVDVRGKLTSQEYDSLIELENKIPFNSFSMHLSEFEYVKKVSNIFDKETTETIFRDNIITYFPAYRYEAPSFLTDPYKVNINFSLDSNITGNLINPLEVVTDLPQLANWIADILLDLNYPLNNLNNYITYQSLNEIITKTLISKNLGNLKLDVGPRKLGLARIRIVDVLELTQKVNAKGQPQMVDPSQTTNEGLPQIVYPSIFHLSSGEAAILCLFGEILRQADKLNKSDLPSNMSGIVLIDEADKHLHIKLQKEVLPQLFKLFPKIQFIITSHSPFLSMGLAETMQDRSRIIDLDNNGLTTAPTTNQLYTEVYEMMINENNNFKNLYEDFKKKIDNETKPLIITEGKTDKIHLEKAKKELAILACDVEFSCIDKNGGDSNLESLLEQFAKVKLPRKIIGIFDRDNPQIIKNIEKEGQPYKTYSNNVYSFCIPIPEDRKSYNNISIEFYYSDKEIQKEKNGRRLYFDNEIEVLYNKTEKCPEYRKLSRANPHKEYDKKIFDERYMCKFADFIHSKTTFANLVAKDTNFNKSFNFDNFNLIFNKIKEIIALQNLKHPNI